MLSAAFLGLAASATTACGSTPAPATEATTFYCVDNDGVIVDEDRCDDDDDDGLVWLAAVVIQGLAKGMRVPSSAVRFRPGDTSARSSWGLPATGRVSNGTTIKTGVVGTSSNGGGGSSGS